MNRRQFMVQVDGRDLSALKFVALIKKKNP